VDQYLLERRQKQDALWSTVAPLPGALKLLRHLYDHSIPIAIATGSQRRNVALKTSHLAHMIELFAGHIVCAEDVERGKPCPDVFLIAANRLGRCVGQGDYTTINEAAQVERRKGLVFEDAVLQFLQRSPAWNSLTMILIRYQVFKRGSELGCKVRELYGWHFLVTDSISVIWVPDVKLMTLKDGGDLSVQETLVSLEDFVPERWGLPPYQ
jgi:pseudouridine 5'-phosphatase